MEAKEKVLEVLEKVGEPLSPKKVAGKARVNRNTARRVLQELYAKGKLKKLKRGLYQVK